MVLFKNPEQSHDHSLKTLDLIYKYDDYLDSLTVIADMGRGAGHDVRWWATLETRDDPPEPHNYIVYAVDQNTQRIEDDVLKLKNVIPIQGNFEEPILPRKVDLIWAHNVFQTVMDPFKCLVAWKETMSVNGMLVLSIPQSTYFDSRANKLMITSHDHQYYSYNILSLMYMLAVNGFDCRDAYLLKKFQDPWIQLAVYKTDQAPMDPLTTRIRLCRTTAGALHCAYSSPLNRSWPQLMVPR